MIFETHTPTAPYSDLIESIFHYKEFQPDHSIERVVPTGHVSILFELDGIARHTYDSKSLEPSATFRRAWISGLHHNHLSISTHKGSEMFVIQFKAFGAYPFLQQPMTELADQVVPGDQFATKDLFKTRERLRSAKTSSNMFAVADEWLAANLDRELIPPRTLLDAVANLQSQPTAKLNDIIDAFDGTHKHLISQFKKYIGITPKQYQRILRFNDVFIHMQSDPFISWSDVANRCGYADQSHFIREFKNFSGFVPKTFLSKAFSAETSNFFPLDRNK